MDAQGELRVRGVSPAGEKLFLFFIFRPKKILTHVPHPCSTTFAFRTPSGAKRAPRSTTDRSRGDRNSTPCSGFTTGTSRYWFFCDRSCPDDTVLTSLSGLSPSPIHASKSEYLMDLVVTSKDRIYLGLFFALLVHMGGVGVSAILYVGSRSVLVLSLSLSPIHHLYLRPADLCSTFLSLCVCVRAGTNFRATATPTEPLSQSPSPAWRSGP